MAGETASPDGGAVALPANVHPVGRLGSPEIAARMAEAAVFAAPARYEPFGLAILEAALSGCALVLGDIPTLRELWDDAALFVVPDDTAALREALATLLSDPEAAAALGRRARRRAGRYTAHRMGEAYVETYASLIAGNGVRLAPAEPLRAGA
jgi:glycosyltransferase involved in cell wall biosynthesis